MSKTLCIYHGNCMDGFTAAWVVRKYHQVNSTFLDMPAFYAGVYGKTPPDVTDCDVIFVDFCYQRPVMLDLAAKAKSIIIIDHHETAMKNMVDMPANVQLKFDMTHSGAMLAWLYFFGKDVAPPLALKCVEDRDLWKFEVEHTREVVANIFSYRYDFDVWDHLMAMDPEKMVADGIAIERKHFKDIAELLEKTKRTMRIGGILVSVANLPYTMSSDAAMILAENDPKGIGACYYDSTDGRVFSLRSTKTGLNVAKIAQLYGGGGHEHASGFEMPRGWEGDE